MLKQQRGISLLGVMFLGGVIVFVAIFAMKVVPAYIEYSSVKRSVVDSSRGKETPQAIRQTFDKFMDVNQISTVTGKDLEITKEGNNYITAFKYTKTIELGKGVRLEIDFAGSSKDE